MSNPVDRPEFTRALAPLGDVLSRHAVALASEPDDQKHLPAPDSRAMAELSASSRWAVPEWAEPVRNAHSYGSFLVYAISEHLSAYAAVAGPSLVGPRYGHMPSVRAVLEAAPISHWLLDPEIGPEVRVKRSIAYRFKSAMNRKQHLRHLPGEATAAEEELAACRGYARRFEWPVGSDGAFGGESVPNPATYAAWALDTSDAEVDRTAWAYACAIQHSTWFGLASGLSTELYRHDPLDPAGTVAPIAASSRDLHLWGFATFVRADAAGRARRQLMGWPEPGEVAVTRERIHSMARAAFS